MSVQEQVKVLKVSTLGPCLSPVQLALRDHKLRSRRSEAHKSLLCAGLRVQLVLRARF